MTQKLDESRGKSLICVIVAIVVVICVISLAISMGELSCELQTHIPDINHSKRPINSEDFKLLAWFSGYLKYLEPMKNNTEAIYLPLDLKTVHLLLDSNLPNIKQIRLSTECAKITLFLREDLERKTISIIQPQLNLTLPVAGNHHCILEGLDDSYSSSKHYSCQDERVYPCKVVTNSSQLVPIVDLIVQSIEFEVDEDNQDKVKSRSYITAPSFCVT